MNRKLDQEEVLVVSAASSDDGEDVVVVVVVGAEDVVGDGDDAVGAAEPKAADNAAVRFGEELWEMRLG